MINLFPPISFCSAAAIQAVHYLHSGPASFEPETLRLWVHLCRSAGWIYDVGAITGVFSLAAATSNPSCMAFEPSSVTYSRLLINIAANDLAGQIAPVRCLARRSERSTCATPPAFTCCRATKVSYPTA